jgi:hypothetical protein
MLVISVFVLTAGAAYSEDLKVTVIRQAGKVEAKPAGTKDWQSSKPDLELKPGDLLRTLKGGKVQLLFPGDAVVLIKENSLLDIKALLPEGGGKVKAVAGDFLFNLGKALSPGSTFEVESPGALAVVRGTIWAEFLTLDGGLLLVSFDNDVELTAGGVTVAVPEGYESEVSPGGTPSDPKPTDMTLEEVESSFKIVEAPATETDIALEAWIIELLRLETDVRLLHREFMRYYDAEYEEGMLLAYRQVPDYRNALDQLTESITDLIEPNDPNALPVANEQMDNDEIKETIQRISDWLDEIEHYIGQFVSNPDERLDEIAGLIPEGDPSAGIRYAQIDSDGDGLGDALELALGLDPIFNNALGGFIETTAPQDGVVFNWPAEQAIEFAYAPVPSDFIGDYRLWIASGGIQYTAPLNDDRIMLSIESLLDPGQGGFARLFDVSNTVSFTWYVTGEIDSSMIDLGGDRVPAQTITQIIASSRRGFDIRIADGGTGILRVVPEAPIVQVDDLIHVDLLVDTESLIQDVTVILRYDPTVLDFEAGRAGAFWQNSILFFSDSTPGEVGISGRVGTATGFVQGAGVLCELDFRVRGGAGSISPLDLLDALFRVPGGAEVSVLRENAVIEVR